MTHKLAAAFVAALLLCAGARLVSAQDNNTNAAPAATDNGMSKKDMKSDKGMHHGMDACKDDVAKFCGDVKGHKKVHECLEKNEDQLSPACKKHHEKMEKRWKKKHGGKDEKGEKDEDKTSAPSKP